MNLVKTEAGLQVLKDRSVALSQRQRSAFILFDGKRTVDEVLAATAAMGVQPQEVEQLVALGLLADREATFASQHADTVPAPLMEQPDQPARPPLHDA